MAKRVRRSNVKDGVLLPLGNGFSLVKGDNPNKTDDVDIGPNNKNGLSVNHGEILQQRGNNLRVFSAEPMLGGVSPVQLLYGGMAPDKVFAMQEAFKDIHGINDDGSRAQFGILRKIKEKLSGKSNNTQTPVKEQEHLSYFDATDEQKKHLQTKLGKYNTSSVGDYGDTHFSVVESRYKSLTDSMRRKGFTSEEIDRLSPFLITQQILEGGYKLTNDTNNFGGILIPGTNKKMSFKSVDDFNDYYLSNLDEKWGDDYLGKGKGWRNAKTLKEYADIINREDLRLYTKEAYDEYNRNHKDNPAYIYTPLWENNNTGLMSEPKFGGIYPRVYGMLDLLKARMNDWDNTAKTNNIVKKEFGGRKRFKNGGDNIPLKLSDIPHDRPIHIIDNYSKNFNYIVQGDKIYYMKKGLNDNWVDISTNDIARSNLFNFLNDRYQFKGYGDREKEIYNQLKAGIYKYNENTNININTNSSENNINNENIQNNNTIISAKTSKPIYQISGGVIPFVDQIKYNSLIQNINSGLHRVSDVAKSYIKRGHEKYLQKDKTIGTLNTETFEDKESNYGIIPQSFVGDTINIKTKFPGRYIIPESLDISEYSFGVRNRGDYTDLNSNNAPITSLFKFDTAKNQKNKNGTYMGVDSKGNFKIGKLSDFNEEDQVARTFANKVYKIKKDDNGNYITHAAKRNKGFEYAIAEMETDDGKRVDGDIQLLLRNNKNTGFYGSVEGGRYIIEVGNEKRLVSGSLENIDKEFENMKKRHGTDYGIFYTLDNGSYSKALRIRKGNITSEHLKLYDKENPRSGGNIAYILGEKQNKYPSDTISTPNIRTINDESYKLGHPLTNEKKGIVLHHTGFSQNDSLGVRKHFQNPKSEASAHVVIMENGDRKVYGTPEQVTFHAGQSRYNGRFNANDFMLGVEFNNPNTQNIPLTDAQIESFVEWAKPIIRENNISLENITTHEEIRKQYNEYVQAHKVKDDKGKTRKPTDSKVDISYKEYKRIIDALLKEVYYKKAFKFGGQTNINSLGERPNAKYRKQMKNKRNKAALGRQQFSISGLPSFDFTIPNSFGNYSLNKPFIATYGSAKLNPINPTLNLPTMDFTPKSTVGQVDPFMGTKPAFGTSTTTTPITNPVGDLTKNGGLSTTAMSAIGAGINTLGALIGSGIQQWAINGIKAPQRQYTLLSPVKLKTKININPQIARMREMQAQIADAARRTSGSSRTAYQKILANHNRLLDSAMNLYGRKENIETELINQDRLNQQRVAQANATNVMNTVNYNNESNVNNENYKRVATSNNWTNALNTTAGAWAGPNGFIDRTNALRVKAGELYTQAIANPTAARLLYGDIDFTTGANKRRAFNTIYDFLNNSRFA